MTFNWKQKKEKKKQDFTKAKINKNLIDMTLEAKKQPPPPSPKRKQVFCHGPMTHNKKENSQNAPTLPPHSKRREKQNLIRSLGCMLAHLIGYLEFSISSSDPHHFWPRLVARAEL
jgi:hypothetical protein